MWIPNQTKHKNGWIVILSLIVLAAFLAIILTPGFRFASANISSSSHLIHADRNLPTANDTYALTTTSPIYNQIAKLTAGDGAAYDRFGEVVAVSGDIIVVGAEEDDDSGNRSGSAYIFTRDQGGADAWSQTTKLTAGGGVAYDSFGISVAVSGDIIVVGANENYTTGSGAGSAYVFIRNQGGADNWGQVAKLVADDGAASDFFGYSVAVSGDTIVVGARLDDDKGSGSGSAYVFVRNKGGADNWGRVAKLIASDGDEADYFGSSVAISGDTIVVGADEDDDKGSGSGSAYIFARNQGGADNWGQVTKLTADDGAAADSFGISVAVSGDTIVVGAHNDDDNGHNSGSAYIFARNQGGADNWGQVRKLNVDDGYEYDYFGWSVAVSDDTTVIGAYEDDDKGNNSGSAYIFTRDQGGADNWGQVFKLTANDGAADDGFGISVAVSGDAIAVGTNDDDDKGTDSGSAYVFARGFGVYLPLIQFLDE